MVAEWIVEPFGKQHDRSQFSCGQPTLDEFLRFQVSQYEKRHLGKTFVAVCPPDSRVLGYFTLASSSIDVGSLPSKAARKLPKHPVPAALLARLAVDQTAQGRGIGEGLLMNALSRTLQLSGSIGIHLLVVHAMDEKAAAFYAKFDFTPLTHNPLHLFLSLETIHGIIALDSANPDSQ